MTTTEFEGKLSELTADAWAEEGCSDEEILNALQDQIKYLLSIWG